MKRLKLLVQWYLIYRQVSGRSRIVCLWWAIPDAIRGDDWRKPKVPA